MTANRLILFLVLIALDLNPFLGANLANAQVGGGYVLGFSKFTSSTRAMATGRRNFTQDRSDVEMLSDNAALMSPDMDGQFSVSTVPIQTGAFYTHAAGSFTIKDSTQLGISADWINFGDFEGYDAIGNRNGNFSAGAYRLQAHYALYSGPFTLGISGFYAQENIENYSVSILGANFSGLFEHPNKNFRIGLLVNNLGLSPNSSLENASLPFDTRLGLSYKLEHLPLRLSFAYHHLHEFNITYYDPSLNARVNSLGEEESKNLSFAQRLMGHFSIGGEFLLSDNLSIFTGYDHLSRQEMRLPNQISSSGFSIGGEVKISYFAFRVGHAWHHSAGGFTSMSLQTDFKRIFYSN